MADPHAGGSLILSAAVPVCPSLAAEDSEYTETYDDTGEDTAEDSGEETEYIPESYYWTVESNEISGWPGGPRSRRRPQWSWMRTRELFCTAKIWTGKSTRPVLPRS